MDEVPSKLKEAAERVGKGEKVTLTVRQLLSWFGYERRGVQVVHDIRDALQKVVLVTKPDFVFEWIDAEIELASPIPPGLKAPTASGPRSLALPPDLTEAKTITGSIGDPTYRIGKLDPANNPPVSVKPDATLSEAVTIMLRDDFSQLPVMTTDREVKGVVTWRSIAKRLFFRGECDSVQECIDTSVEIVSADVSLFGVITLVAKNDFVLVRNKEKKISGIVTASDLSNSFYELGRPFLLLSEIENHLRGMIDGKFTVDELRTARNPSDVDREVTAVSDLTFGEYVRLLQNPDLWGKVGLAIDRVAFVKDLEKTNGIRNDVMHFDPEGIAPDDLIYLEKQARFIQELHEILGVSKVGESWVARR